jgi:hypothetical protein
MLLRKGALYRTKNSVFLAAYEPDPAMVQKMNDYAQRGWTMEFPAFRNIVPEQAIVMYVETGKTGSYRLIYEDFVGWTTETLNLLEEINPDGEGEAL